MDSAQAFEIAKFCVSLLTLGSLAYAVKTYRANQRKQQEDRIRDADKELLAQARLSLKWAYDALTDEGKQIPPQADRLNWLTAARHILRHTKLASAIQTATYRAVHAEHEEFWRHKFYLALDDPSLGFADYYRPPAGSAVPVNLDPGSVAVVLAFSHWPEEKVDPIDGLNVDAIGGGIDGRAWRGFSRYREEIQEWRNPKSARTPGHPASKAGTP